ncbi:MAG: DUF2125 domain-containing protein [Rhodobacterales bacterium]|nr:DUF2125 domain-containing protein [Rhodobacterales bacterium]
MFRTTSCFAAPAFVLLMGGTAHAALTADQVWQSWKDAGAVVGLEVSAATENKDGGTLTLNGVSVAPAGTSGLTISDMVLTEQSDGSVTIAPGADIGVALTGDTKGTAKLVHDGLTLTAREADGGLAYDYAATKLDVVYDTTSPGMSFDGSAAPEVKSSGTVGFAGLSGTYSDIPGTNRTIGLDLKADALDYTTASDDPSMEMKQKTTSETANVEISFDFALPSTTPMTSMGDAASFGAALQEGMSVSFSTKQGDSNGTMNQESAFMPMDMVIKAGGGEATGLFNKDTFSIKSSGSGLAIDVTSAMLPVPVKITSGAIEFGLTSPVMAADAAGDYGFVMKLSQFSVNEEAWAMLDPGGALSREAADIAIDVSGKTKLDFVGMIAAEETGVEPPVPAVETLDINQLALKVAGAALTGTGAFTFDNTSGMPMPLGEANVSVTGANALIDGLIKTGLVAEQDAMGARMMMGAFMSPGANPDELTSKIEAKAGGEIYVNGQRVQ